MIGRRSRTGRPRRSEREDRPAPTSERPCPCSTEATAHAGRYAPELGDLVWTCSSCGRSKVPQSAARADETLVACASSAR